jgi:LPS export ABC transporter protein LptC
MRLWFFLSVVLSSCSNDPEVVKEFIISKDLPIEKIEGAELLHTDNGNLKVRIVASTIERFQNKQPQLIFSNGLEVIFYKDTIVQSILESENAEIDEQKKIMIASNNVILTSSDGKKLETEELIWDEKENKIYTNNKVVITTGREVVEGDGFVSNPDFTEYSISKIHGTFDFETSTE